MKTNVTLLARDARYSGKTTILMICKEALEKEGYALRHKLSEHKLNVLSVEEEPHAQGRTDDGEDR